MTLRRSPMVLLALLLLGTANVRGADTAEAIRYTLRFPSPQSHYVEVEAVMPAGKQSHAELMMPVWTPGSYMVREYSRHVEGIAARGPDGKALGIEKTRKNRWRVKNDGAASFTLSYRVYCREMSVRTNWVDSGFALLNGAATFVTLADRTPRPHDVRVVPAHGWLTTVTGLAEAPDREPHHYLAPDFDTLVDSPIVAGNPTVYQFEVDGKPHFLVNEGEGGVWDGPRSARDLEAIVREQRKFWGSLPYSKYVFLNMIVESGGGLEHKNSTVLMTTRWATRTRKAYTGWLNLASHEFFHAWNVKRLRPVELGPFDYENEVYSRSLWVAEGITDYYGRLLVKRAGLTTREEYLGGEPPQGPGAGADRPSGDVEMLQTTPGRQVQPLELSSLDAWIKYYRPDENAANSSVSYYNKGAVVGFLLDAKIRKTTKGTKSLDDAMRLAYRRYSGEKGYTPEEFRATVEEVAGADLKGWFHRAVETGEELDYSDALDTLGLRFRMREKPKRGIPEKASLGLVVRPENGRLLVAQVRRGTAGFEAGFNVDDEILAIGDYRVRAEQWSARMDQYRPNEKASILVARRDRLIRLDATFATETPRVWTIEANPDARPEAKGSLRGWLGEPSVFGNGFIPTSQAREEKRPPAGA